MSYICENCGIRPEACICSSDITEPRLELELSVADNIMALENPVIQRPYGLIDAPSPAAFFSLLVEMEKNEVCNTPITMEDLLPIPKLERQTNRPNELCLSQNHLDDVRTELFPEPIITDADFSEFKIDLIHCEACENFSCECFNKLAKEKYETAKECGTYEYDKFCRDFPENGPKCCADCGKRFFTNCRYEICYECETKMMEQDFIDQRLYPDDIPMELRYNRDSF